jgi:hypothetical protein
VKLLFVKTVFLSKKYFAKPFQHGIGIASFLNVALWLYQLDTQGANPR